MPETDTTATQPEDDNPGSCVPGAELTDVDADGIPVEVDLQAGAA